MSDLGEGAVAGFGVAQFLVLLACCACIDLLLLSPGLGMYCGVLCVLVLAKNNNKLPWWTAPILVLL